MAVQMVAGFLRTYRYIYAKRWRRVRTRKEAGEDSRQSATECRRSRERRENFRRNSRRERFLRSKRGSKRATTRASDAYPAREREREREREKERSEAKEGERDREGTWRRISENTDNISLK